MVRANMGLVGFVAKKAARRNADTYADLVQEGSLGLIRAVQKFDPTRGVKFSTYAMPWIRAFVFKHITDDRTIRVAKTANQRKLVFSLRREQAKAPDATPEALAERLKVTSRDIIEMDQRLSHRTVDHETVPLPGAAGPEAEVERAQVCQVVRERLATTDLDTRDTLILKWRLLSDDPITLEEVGKRLGLSRGRAQQIEASLKAVLRDRMADLADLASHRDALNPTESWAQPPHGVA